MVQITKDNAYDAVAPDDFPAMLDVERYGKRSTAFDKIISATHDHFWDPLDKKYIDFTEPFDLKREHDPAGRILPDLPTRSATHEPRDSRSNSPTKPRAGSCRRSCMASRARSRSRPRSATSCSDPGAQEYAANQTREEARHVTAFAAYIKARWGTPLPVRRHAEERC